jgi:hypothetical protein
MVKQKFDPELASEMEWSECVLAASIVNEESVDEPGTTTWFCGVCDNNVLILPDRDELAQLAQEFLDHGWRYRRTKKGNTMDAVCPNCRNSHKK